jgi:hypothetical protein
MCTTGVRHFADGSYVLFKNKDFGRAHLDDRVWLDDDVFGVLGMTTWNENGGGDRYSGFSIGANRHGVLCCDSNVATLDDHVNYDEMTEVALRHGTDVGAAVDAVVAACERAPVSWANLVLIDATSAAALEIRGHTVHVEWLDGPTARSNHHIELGHIELGHIELGHIELGHIEPGPHDVGQHSVTSLARLESAQRRLAAADGVDDVIELLRSHDDGDGSGVCNHRDLTTVYSYLLHVHGGVCDLHVTQGQPCRSDRKAVVTVPFGEHASADRVAAFVREYPSCHAGNAATTAS